LGRQPTRPDAVTRLFAKMPPRESKFSGNSKHFYPNRPLCAFAARFQTFPACATRETCPTDCVFECEHGPGEELRGSLPAKI
jgi:hypothetical protein